MTVGRCRACGPRAILVVFRMVFRMADFRIGVVAEGFSDFARIVSIVETLRSDVVVSRLQPNESAAFRSRGLSPDDELDEKTGFGWGGVVGWCRARQVQGHRWEG